MIYCLKESKVLLGVKKERKKDAMDNSCEIHGNGHGHGHDDHTEVNRLHWNNAASSYNSRFEKTMEQLADEIRSRREWIGGEWIEDDDDDDDEDDEEGNGGAERGEEKNTARLLDYACGTGMVSRALAPYVTQCVGIDLSTNMVHEYNSRALNQGIPPSEMQAHEGNLISPTSTPPSSFSTPEFHNFSLAVVALGFHHFDDCALAAKRLVERLKSGGVLLILDFLPHEHMHAHHEAAKTVRHMGFGEGEIRKIFEEAGAGGGFEYTVIGKAISFVAQDGKGERMERRVFMARGTKG